MWLKELHPRTQRVKWRFEIWECDLEAPTGQGLRFGKLPSQNSWGGTSAGRSLARKNFSGYENSRQISRKIYLQTWRVPNPPGANPLVAERAPWRSSQSCVTGRQQPIGNPYRFLSLLLHTWQPLCDPDSHLWGRLFPLPGG